MSITEFPNNPGSALEAGPGWSPYDDGGQARGGGDRTPPQDNNAEQSVLGAMLLSKDAIADVIEAVRGTDFYRPAHETIFDAVVDLYGRGEPADPVTVSAELQRRGDLSRIGGAPYLHTLSASVPIAANAGYYAEIVREKAILRRLVDAGTRIAQWGYSGEGQVDDVVDRAQAEVYGVTEKRTSEDYAPLSDIMESTLDEIEAISNRDGEMVGVPTGFADLDELTNGLHGGQMVIVAARPAVGKALAVGTPLATPSGWTTMGVVRVGDQVYGADGLPTTVVAATEIMVDRPCYEVVFADGSTIVADSQHQWLTQTRGTGDSSTAVVTTEHLASAMSVVSEPGASYAVANGEPIQTSARQLLVPAYVLGVWLAVGDPANGWFTTETPEIPLFIEGLGVGCAPMGGTLYSLILHDAGPFDALLHELGVLENKHIPTDYLRASEADRRALLAGLLDTEGVVLAGSGEVRIGLTDERLAGDVYELVVSLGFQCSHRTGTVLGRGGEPMEGRVLTFGAWDAVFRSHGKAVLHKEVRPATADRVGRRSITEVRKVQSVPVRCIEVDNADHLYLAGESMVPTHNSTLGLDICRSASIRHNLASVIFSLEMTRNEITMRLLSAEAKIPLNHMRNGHMNDEDWAKLARKMGEVSSAPFFIDDSPNMTMMEIRAKARRLKQRHDLRLIVIDYLQLMSSGKKVESRQLEVSEFSRQIKLLAKELDIPVVALSQLNRGPEQRSDKRPLMSDLRESGCLTADSRLMRADDNTEITLGELIRSEITDIPVWCLDSRLKLVPRTMTRAFSSGRKQVHELTLASGRTVQATANHPFLTYDGWVPLRELVPGSRIASVRHVPPPLEITPGDVPTIARAGDRLAAREDAVEEWVFSLPKDQLALYLRHVWAGRGSVDVNDRGVWLASRSQRFVDDVARLLLRFNVFTHLETGDGQRASRLIVRGGENQLRFLDSVGVLDVGDDRASCLAAQLRGGMPTEPDTGPGEVWENVRTVLAEKATTPAGGMATSLSAGGSAVSCNGRSRQRMGRVATILDDADLEVVATNDVHWDTVASVEPLGVQEVFDATVMGNHNFVVAGIPAHNSIEQDADMVILLHREDVYEKESTRPGEADLIVAKHRNGPTRDVVVAFQGHYSRFVDMAQG